MSLRREFHLAVAATSTAGLSALDSKSPGSGRRLVSRLQLGFPRVCSTPSRSAASARNAPERGGIGEGAYLPASLVLLQLSVGTIE